MTDPGGRSGTQTDPEPSSGGAVVFDGASVRRVGVNRGQPAAGTDSRDVQRDGDGGEPTVLHVDDDPRLGPLVAEFLERAGDATDVLIETSARSALQHVEAGDVDCLVTDVDMPGMDGVELVRALAADHGDLPVVVFSGHRWDAFADDLPDDSVAAYVHKSTGHDQFQAVAEAVASALD